MNGGFREHAGPRPSACQACGAPTAQAELTFAPDGRQVCRRCYAYVQVQEAHARQDAASNAGAKFLNPIGKAAMRNPAVFARLMVLAIIGLPVFVIVAVALAFAAGESLRDCIGH